MFGGAGFFFRGIRFKRWLFRGSFLGVDFSGGSYLGGSFWGAWGWKRLDSFGEVSGLSDQLVGARVRGGAEVGVWDKLKASLEAVQEFHTWSPSPRHFSRKSPGPNLKLPRPQTPAPLDPSKPDTLNP